MTASDPNYPAWDWLLTMRAQFINAALFWDLCQLPEVERRATVAELTDAVEQAFKELSR
jgi:hypothetical protein